MRELRFTDSQMMATVEQAEAGAKLPVLSRECGISIITSYKWRSRFGGMGTSMMKRLNDEIRR